MARGCIRKRGKVYYVVNYLGKDNTGKKKYKWEAIGTSKKEAERILTQRQQELNNGTFISNTKITVKEYLYYWYTEYCIKKLAKITYEGYKRNIDKHIIPCIGNILLVNLKPLHIQNLYNDLSNISHLSNKTIKQIHNILHKALAMAVKWEFAIKNVTNCVDIPQPEQYIAKVLNEQEINILLSNLINTEIYLPVLLAIGTGLRRGEIIALTWNNVDLENKTLSVTTSAVPTKNELTIKQPKTAHSNRTISLSNTIVEELKKVKYQQSIQKRFLKENYIDNDLVFCKDNGEYYKPDTLSHIFKRYIDKLNISKVRFHDLRHTHASLLVKENFNFKAISERLGHSSIGITLNTYSHTYEATNTEIANTFDKFLNNTEISKRLAN